MEGHKYNAGRLLLIERISYLKEVWSYFQQLLLIERRLRLKEASNFFQQFSPFVYMA